MKKSVNFLNLVLIVAAVAAPSFATAEDVKLGMVEANPVAVNCKGDELKKVVEDHSESQAVSTGERTGIAL